MRNTPVEAAIAPEIDVEPASTPFTNRRTTDPSIRRRQMRPGIQRQRRRPDRVPLRADEHLPQRPPGRLIGVEPIDDPARTFLEHHRPPATSADGRTHASSVIPVVRSSELASGTVTQSLTPSKLNADPNRPAALHTAPETEPHSPARRIRNTRTRARVEPIRSNSPTERCLHESRGVGVEGPASRSNEPPRHRPTTTGIPERAGAIVLGPCLDRDRVPFPRRERLRRGVCRAGNDDVPAGRTGRNVRFTFFGWTSRVTMVVTPRESVAVNWISR